MAIARFSILGLLRLSDPPTHSVYFIYSSYPSRVGMGEFGGMVAVPLLVLVWLGFTEAGCRYAP
jgi:hypothetical protein